MLKSLAFPLVYVLAFGVALSSGTVNAQQPVVPAQSCIINDPSGALETGNSIAHGSDLTRQYAVILQNSELFQDPYYQVEPTHLAYAFYVIAERANLAGARQKQEWLIPYIEPDIRDKITATIYKNYTLSYIKQCFVPRKKNTIDHNFGSEVPSFLYMDGM